MTAIVSKCILMPHRTGWGRPCRMSGCNNTKAHQVEPPEHSSLAMCKVRLKSREKGGGRSMQLSSLNQTLIFTPAYQKIADLTVLYVN